MGAYILHQLENRNDQFANIKWQQIREFKIMTSNYFSKHNVAFDL